jgi:4-hydroxybutyryl-CoA dehydratase/vinylacetyl-CoA-Delta-isomerase
MTVPSHLTGETINRFTHVHQSIDDLVKKVRMMRLLGQKTGTCFQQCVGLDALNALYATTYDMDRKNGTHYHERFKKYLVEVQKNDSRSAYSARRSRPCCSRTRFREDKVTPWRISKK